MLQKKCILLLTMVVLLLVLSCRNNPRLCEKSREMNFINKAGYCFTGFESISVDEQNSETICHLLNDSSSLTEEVSVKSNSGFIEVTTNGEITFFIIFSDLNGPVIRYNRVYFRNDRLVLKVMKLLEMELRDDAAKECFSPILEKLSKKSD